MLILSNDEESVSEKKTTGERCAYPLRAIPSSKPRPLVTAKSTVEWVNATERRLLHDNVSELT
jgi:hypothetical protein